MSKAKRLRVRSEIAGVEGIALGNLGVVFRKLKEHNRAIECYTERLKIAYETNDRMRVSIGLGSIGNIYYDLGELEKAKECFQKAFYIDQEIGHKSGEVNWAWNLGLIYERFGEYQQAIKFMQIQ